MLNANAQISSLGGSHLNKLLQIGCMSNAKTRLPWGRVRHFCSPYSTQLNCMHTWLFFTWWEPCFLLSFIIYRAPITPFLICNKLCLKTISCTVKLNVEIKNTNYITCSTSSFETFSVHIVCMLSANELRTSYVSCLYLELTGCCRTIINKFLQMPRNVSTPYSGQTGCLSKALKQISQFEVKSASSFYSAQIGWSSSTKIQNIWFGASHV
jgi:hypothetical protein